VGRWGTVHILVNCAGWDKPLPFGQVYATLARLAPTVFAKARCRASTAR
jgi:hypothetical protein